MFITPMQPVSLVDSDAEGVALLRRMSAWVKLSVSATPRVVNSAFGLLKVEGALRFAAAGRPL
jgi:hypothetical protein